MSGSKSNVNIECNENCPYHRWDMESECEYCSVGMMGYVGWKAICRDIRNDNVRKEILSKR